MRLLIAMPMIPLVGSSFKMTKLVRYSVYLDFRI
jgi:hypothetical protein